jgi:hypothetical protein
VLLDPAVGLAVSTSRCPLNPSPRSARARSEVDCATRVTTATRARPMSSKSTCTPASAPSTTTAASPPRCPPGSKLDEFHAIGVLMRLAVHGDEAPGVGEDSESCRACAVGLLELAEEGPGLFEGLAFEQFEDLFEVGDHFRRAPTGGRQVRERLEKLLKHGNAQQKLGRAIDADQWNQMIPNEVHPCVLVEALHAGCGFQE